MEANLSADQSVEIFDHCGMRNLLKFLTRSRSHLLFLHGEQLTVPLITRRSSKENNDSLFSCPNEG